MHILDVENQLLKLPSHKLKIKRGLEMKNQWNRREKFHKAKHCSKQISKRLLKLITSLQDWSRKKENTNYNCEEWKRNITTDMKR